VELPLGLGAQFVALGLVIGDEEQLVVVPQSRFVVVFAGRLAEFPPKSRA